MTRMKKKEMIKLMEEQQKYAIKKMKEIKKISASFDETFNSLVRR